MVKNNQENRVKLVDALMEAIEYDEIFYHARQKLLDDYEGNDMNFQEDYNQQFVVNFKNEPKEWNGIVYAHRLHSNPAVVGELLLKRNHSVLITHMGDVNIEGADDLRDITKVWDMQILQEYGPNAYYSPEEVMCIPLDIEQHVSLSNQLLKQILINNKVEFVTLRKDNTFISLESFLEEHLGLKE